MSLIESLQSAILDSNLEQVQELIQAGVVVNEPLEDEDTFLMSAASRGYFDIVRVLVEAGADVNAISRHSAHALSMAAQGCYQEVFDYLAPLCSPEVRKWAQEDALLAAAPDRDAEVVHLLAKAGTDLNARDDYGEGETALMLATEFRNMEFVQALLQFGADVNAQDNNGRTALMLAAKYRTDVEAKKTEGAAERQAQIIRLLAEAGADLNIADSNGKTPLILAAESGSPKAVETLIQLGAEVNFKDIQSNTALFYAEKRHNAETKEILKNAGAT